MYTKKEIKEIVKQLSKETGFPFDMRKLKYQQSDGNLKGSFDPITKTINIIGIISDESNEFTNGQMKFSTSHEFGHSLLDFVLKNNITKENVENLNIKEYNSLLKQYFKIPFIKATEMDLSNFKNAIINSLMLEEKHRDILLFDDKYYTNNESMFGYDKLYSNNTSEVFANYFAYKNTVGTIGDINVSNEFKTGLMMEIQSSVMGIDFDNTDREYDTIYEQMKLFYEQQNIPKTDTEITKECKQNNIDFKSFYSSIFSEMQKMHQTIKEYKKQYPTKREQFYIDTENKKEQEKIEYSKSQIQQLVNTDSRVSVIDNFKPHMDDKFFKIEQENIYSLANTAKANLCNTFSPICEEVIDIENYSIYCFREPRNKIITTELEEEVLSDKITMSSIEEEKTKEVNNDDHDGR